MKCRFRGAVKIHRARKKVKLSLGIVAYAISVFISRCKLAVNKTKKSHDEYRISPPCTTTSIVPIASTQQLRMSQTRPAGVPSVPVPTGLSRHPHQLRLRRHKKRTSKLRTALECFSWRVIRRLMASLQLSSYSIYCK